MCRGGYIFYRLYIFVWKRKRNHQFAAGFLVQHRVISAVNRVAFVTDRMHIVLRGRWCHIIFSSFEKRKCFFVIAFKICFNIPLGGFR